MKNAYFLANNLKNCKDLNENQDLNKYFSFITLWHNKINKLSNKYFLVKLSIEDSQVKNTLNLRHRNKKDKCCIILPPAQRSFLRIPYY